MPDRIWSLKLLGTLLATLAVCSDPLGPAATPPDVVSATDTTAPTDAGSATDTSASTDVRVSTDTSAPMVTDAFTNADALSDSPKLDHPSEDAPDVVALEDLPPDVQFDAPPDVQSDVHLDVQSDVPPDVVSPRELPGPGHFSTLGVRAWGVGAIRVIDDELVSSARLCSGADSTMICVTGGLLR